MFSKILTIQFAGLILQLKSSWLWTYFDALRPGSTAERHDILAPSSPRFQGKTLYNSGYPTWLLIIVSYEEEEELNDTCIVQQGDRRWDLIGGTWALAWLLLALLINHRHKGIALLEGWAPVWREQVPDPTNCPHLVGVRRLVARLLCKSQLVTHSIK